MSAATAYFWSLSSLHLVYYVVTFVICNFFSSDIVAFLLSIEELRQHGWCFDNHPGGSCQGLNCWEGTCWLQGWLSRSGIAPFGVFQNQTSHMFDIYTICSIFQCKNSEHTKAATDYLLSPLIALHRFDLHDANTAKTTRNQSRNISQLLDTKPLRLLVTKNDQQLSSGDL